MPPRGRRTARVGESRRLTAMAVNGDAGPSFLSRFAVHRRGLCHLFWIFQVGTREKRWEHEASAYSVENDGCAEIVGTLSGARFDDELRGDDNGGRGAASSSSSSSSSRNRPTHAAGSSGQQGAGASSESDAVNGPWSMASMKLQSLITSCKTSDQRAF